MVKSVKQRTVDERRSKSTARGNILPNRTNTESFYLSYGVIFVRKVHDGDKTDWRIDVCSTDFIAVLADGRRISYLTKITRIICYVKHTYMYIDTHVAQRRCSFAYEVTGKYSSILAIASRNDSSFLFFFLFLYSKNWSRLDELLLSLVFCSPRETGIVLSCRAITLLDFCGLPGKYLSSSISLPIEIK